MNEYLYKDEGKTRKLRLPIGEISPVSKVETELISENFDSSFYKGMTFIADTNGKEKATFFSTRGAYKITKGKFQYIEVKGCGVPNRGISREYFLEDGRDEDEIKDPIGGFSLVKASKEWSMLEKLWKNGIETHIPIALLRLKGIKGPKKEDLALIIRSGKSNIRLSYLENVVLNNIEQIKEKSLYVVGKSLSIMHKKLGLCHNALHEENITLNGEIVDLEYASSSTERKIYRDIWYGLLSFAEVFGSPCNISKFVKGYCNRKRELIIDGKELSEIEENSKHAAEKILNL